MTTLPNTNLLDGATAEHYVYSGGDNGTTVEHYKVINGGHTWPGASINVGVTCLDFSASKEIWRFFSQYSLNTALTESKPSVFSISPNPASSSLTIHMKELMDAEALIMDLQGKILVRKHITNQSLSLPIHDIPSGIYMLHIRTTNGIYQQKWMKE
jgi:polyhydroxybutyrate depolymerase